MTYLFVAFRSRSAAALAYNKLSSLGVNCSIFSTPSAANVGCGLSIKFNEQSINEVRSICAGVTNCAGFFRSMQTNGKTFITRL